MNKQITIGNTYFNRDIIHPEFVVNKSLLSNKHELIGSGRMTFVNDFIRDIYQEFDLKYEDFVSEDLGSFIEYDKTNEYYLKSKNCLYSYRDLINKTKKDILKNGRSN